MNIPLVGCGCHALQLIVKHAMPPLKYKPASASKDESESSSSSSSSSSDSEHVEVVAVTKKRTRDPDHEEMQEKMEPIAKRMRSIVRFFLNNDDAMTLMEQDAITASTADCKIECIAYAAETATRWSSFLDSGCTLLVNNRAHAITAAKHNTKRFGKNKTKFIPPLNEEEEKDVLYILCALQPVKSGTKMVEGAGEHGLASMYLPARQKVQVALSAKTFDVPKQVVHLYGPKVELSKMSPVAKALVGFLHADLDKIQKKFLTGTAGDKLLQMASWLDRRFKDHPSIKKDVPSIKEEVQKMAFKLSEEYPAILELHKREEYQPLVSLVPKKPAKVKATKKAAAKPKVSPSDFAMPESKRTLRRLTSGERFMFGEEADPEPEDVEKIERNLKSRSFTRSRCGMVLVPSSSSTPVRLTSGASVRERCLILHWWQNMSWAFLLRQPSWKGFLAPRVARSLAGGPACSVSVQVL